jgi:hypothetical protein
MPNFAKTDLKSSMIFVGTFLRILNWKKVTVLLVRKKTKNLKKGHF